MKFRQATNLAIDRSKIAAGVKTHTPAHEFLAQHFGGQTHQEIKRDTETARNLLSSVPNLDLTKEYEVSVFSGSDKQKHEAYVQDNVWLVPLFEKKLLVSVDPKRVNSVGVQFADDSVITCVS